ncbi:hypothetical protein ACHAXA_000443 [Cyclostephanos tholiformis]|uniref:Deacetylase sirtuin-type domain-containing protein n=1 Tax=Cyclostephanos tholiformis TaxID=382380 RepID=A0ABD3RVW4_9STRA
MKCGTAYSANDIASDVLSGTVPLCIRPRRKKAKVAVVIAGGEMEGRTVLRHSARLISTSTYATTSKSDDDNGRRGVLVTGGGSCGGIIKPNVTFFGEKLDDGVGRRLEKDSLRADALLVMGTSLSVAPMSKVVNYLKPDIPRILINRNIVRVPKISSTDDGYPFHACLLGDCGERMINFLSVFVVFWIKRFPLGETHPSPFFFLPSEVDVVVEALARRMEGMYAGKKSSTTGIERDGATTNGSTSIDETRLHDQPKECILLFDGADVSNSSDEAQVQQKLVVHCDECHDAIEGRVYCCKTCFDYDLCGACYPFSSLAHANGKHDFAVER